MQSCPCGSGLAFAECCEPIIRGDKIADSAEALMRSRYSAYVSKDIGYLGESLHPSSRRDWDEAATRRWAEGSEWLGLEVVRSEPSEDNADEALVEFIASFREGGQLHKHHELAHFVRDQGRWYYQDGSAPKPQTVRLATPKVGRNDPCPCGSGKKYKKCCGAG